MTDKPFSPAAERPYSLDALGGQTGAGSASVDRRPFFPWLTGEGKYRLGGVDWAAVSRGEIP